MANRDTESPTGFDNRDDSSGPWTGSLAADMQSIFAPDRYRADRVFR